MPVSTSIPQSLTDITNLPLVVLLNDFNDCRAVVALLSMESDSTVRCHIPEIRGLAFFSSGAELDAWWEKRGLHKATDLRYIIEHEQSLPGFITNLSGRIDIWATDQRAVAQYADRPNVHVFVARDLPAFLAATGLISAPGTEISDDEEDFDDDDPVQAITDTDASLMPDADLTTLITNMFKTQERDTASSRVDRDDDDDDDEEEGDDFGEMIDTHRGRVSQREQFPLDEFTRRRRRHHERESGPGGPGYQPWPGSPPEEPEAKRPPAPASPQMAQEGEYWAFDYLARVVTPSMAIPDVEDDELDDEETVVRKLPQTQKPLPSPKLAPPRTRKRGGISSLFMRSSGITDDDLRELAEMINAVKPITIALGSEKGGTGKTTSAKEMSIIAGKACSLNGAEVAFIDANLTNPNAWDNFQIPANVPTVQDIAVALARNELPPRDDMLRSVTTPGLVVFPESHDEVQYGEEDIEMLVKEYFHLFFPISVVDLTNRKPAASTSPEAKAAEAWLHQSDALVIPMRLEPADMRSTVQYLDTPDLPPTIVIYITPRDKTVLKRQEVQEYLRDIRERVFDVLEVPDSNRVATANFEGQAVAELAPEVGVAYTKILKRCLEAVAENRRHGRGGRR